MANSFTSQRRLSSAKVKEFELIENFNIGYRNRENVTKLPPGILVNGSQNVLTNTSGRIGARKGYVLDGVADAAFLLQENEFLIEQEDGSLIIL